MKNLLLLHGALGHSDLFIPYKEELSRYFHLHTPLFSGHGDTKLPEDGISIEKYVQEIHTYCKENHLKNVHIFGHSMGGYVGLCYALQQPDYVHSVITLGTKFEWTEEQALKETAMLNPETILTKVPQYAEQLEAQHSSQWKQLLSAIADLMIDLGRNPVLNQNNLATMNLPVQVMLGDKDNMVSIDESKRFYRSILNAKLSILPDTKHPMDKVRPKLLIDLMKDFWNEY